jgi:ABC-type uncharacterized transport system substrate-binding protein
MWLGATLAALLLGAPPLAQPEPDRNVYILLSDVSSHYSLVARTIADTLKQQHAEGSVAIGTLMGTPPIALNGDTLIIAVGTKATRRAITEHPGKPLLSLFLTRSAWRNLSEEAGADGRRAVVFLDNPPRRLFYLASLIKPEARRIGTVFGPVSQAYKRPLRDAMAGTHYQLIAADLTHQDNPVARLTPVIENSDLFLALPDRAFFNRNVAKWILYLSFRNKIPVIGFSESYTRAGALASLYSSAADIGRQGAELAESYLRSPADFHWRSFDPAYFSIEINPAVARALDMELPTPETLRLAIEKLEEAAEP